MEMLTKAEAVSRMIAVLNAEEPRHFHVGLVGYFIEGTPYSADALTVDGDSTMDLTSTDDGFSCFAFSRRIDSLPKRAPESSCNRV